MSIGRYLCESRVLRAIGVLGLLALVLAVRLPNSSRLLAVLNDAAHAPVFGLIALFLAGSIRHGTLVRRIMEAFVATLFLGILVEVIQGFTGRDASWFDVWTDALGALCALGLYVSRRPTPEVGPELKRSALGVAIAAGLLVLYPVGEAVSAYALRASGFPGLLDFDQPLSRYFVETPGTRTALGLLPHPWAHESDPTSLEVKVLQGEYPGISLVEPFPVWVGYQELKLDVTNPGETSLPLTIRVHDRTHDNRLLDRFNRTFELAPASRIVLSVPLGEIAAAPRGRTLDLGNVAGLILFTSGQGAQPGRSFFVTGAWLE